MLRMSPVGYTDAVTKGFLPKYSTYVNIEVGYTMGQAG